MCYVMPTLEFFYVRLTGLLLDALDFMMDYDYYLVAFYETFEYI